MSRIAKRYAKALFSLAEGATADGQSNREALAAVAELFAVAEAGRILNSPVMPNELKQSLLDYALEKGQAGQDVRNLTATLLDAGRIAHFPAVIAAYDELLDEAAGVAKATVTSAMPMAGEEMAAIGAELGRLIRKKVEVSSAIDPNLLGGFVATVGHFRVDLSVRTRLEELAHRAVGEVRGGGNH